MQNENQCNEIKYLRIKGVIERYSISRSTIYNLIKSSKIKPRKLSKGITLYSIEELDTLFNTEVA